jgi:hypothetical protein
MCAVMLHTCILALVAFQAIRSLAIVPSLFLILDSAMRLQSLMALEIRLAIQSFVPGAAFANVDLREFSVDVRWRKL